MNEINPINSKEYLDRHLGDKQDIPEAEIRKSLERLDKPIVDIKYEDAGKAEIEASNYKLKFDYSPVDSQDENEVRVFIGANKGRVPEKEVTKFFNIKNWKRLNSLTIKPNKSEKVIDVLEIISRKCKIFFYLADNYIYGSYIPEQGNIYLICNMASLGAIALLLHETGHVLDLKEMEANKFEDINLAEKLRRERTASAFALKVARSFLSKEERKDVANYLIHHSLKSYKDDIKKQLVIPDAKSHLAQDHEYDEDAEDRERQIWDRWWEFRKTDEYKKWKEMGEFKDLDEYEEYSAWCEWAEKQSKES